MIAALVAASLCASEGEQVFSLGGEYVASTGHGGGASARWTLGLDDFWNVTIDVAWARLVDETEQGDTDRLAGGVGVLYHLDAFQWVPYAVFAVEVDGWLDPADKRWGLGLELGGGIDYRPWSRFSVGVYALWHAMIYGDAPRHASYGARTSWYF